MAATQDIIYLVILLMLSLSAKAKRYEPTWDSLDSRPLPAWYDEAKFGIFIHWGVFSVPSYGSEWFWYNWKGHKYPDYIEFMQKNYPPDFTYQDFASQFTAEFYDPNQWADIFVASGARYIVLTSKHHEGYTNWPSKVAWNWNSMDVGPNRDLVGELGAAIRNKTNLHFGLYHSLFEWFNPHFNSDKDNGFKTQEFVKRKTMPELYELVNNYKPDIVWSDGEGNAPPEYWNSTHFLAWLYNDSPVKDTVVTNDRWGIGCGCHHGGFFTCSDKYNPGTLQKHKWENCMTIDSGSWGYRRNVGLSSYLTIEQLLTTMAETISCGGNLLMNVGPTHDGRIVPIFEERLRQMGQWLKVNGEAIYASKPWSHQNDTMAKDVWYTSQKSDSGSTIVYAILTKWPQGDLILGAPKASAQATITMLGYPHPFTWETLATGGLKIHIPSISDYQMESRWAWVLRMEGIQN